MQVNAIPAAASSTSNQAAPTTTAAAGLPEQTLSQDDFLRLLSVQMQSQDPLEPMKDTEFISQMANFTSLQTMSTLSSSFDAFTAQQTTINAATYLGKTVTVLDPNSASGYTSGEVTGVTYVTGTPQVIVNGQTYDPSMISDLTNTTPSATPAAPAAPTTN